MKENKIKLIEKLKKSDTLTKIIIVNVIILIILVSIISIIAIKEYHFYKTHIYVPMYHDYIPIEELPVHDFQ